MKKILLVLCALAAPVINGAGQGNNPCAGKSSGFSSLGICCNEYLECRSDDAAVLHQCPEGLFWNSEMDICDLPMVMPGCQGGPNCDVIASGPGGGITCSSGTSGRCFAVAAEEGLFGVCRFYCKWTGSPANYCSSCVVLIFNLCSAFAVSCGG